MQTYCITSGIFKSATIHVGGTAIIDSAVSTISDLTVDVDGGDATCNATVSTGNWLAATIDEHGSFTFGSSFSSSAGEPKVDFGIGGGTLAFGGRPGFVWPAGATINQFAVHDSDYIDDQSIRYDEVTSYKVAVSAAGQLMTFYDGKTADLSLSVSGTMLRTGSFAPEQSGGALSLSRDSDGDLLFTPNTCFLRGSAIATPEGEKAIERLAVGDLVSVRLDGATASRPVRWLGWRSIDVARSADCDAAYPVRIRAHALAEHVPHRDLLITAEHCIHIDGMLIPARMLVNASSICVERSILRYEYFHIELESHGILIAEGLETESYMDTGNRVRFANAAVAAPQIRKNRALDAAAPLAVDRATVEPVWRRLAERAECRLGLPRPVAVALTGEPDFRLVTQTGLAIKPTLFDGRVYGFIVPPGTRSLRLLSRASSPAETVGPFVDDRRSLGLHVGQVGLGIGRRRMSLDAHLLPGPIEGWHDLDPAAPGSRWTIGDARLPADLAILQSEPGFLEIEVKQAGPYLAGAAIPLGEAVAA